jgi:hypothetical protein
MVRLRQTTTGGAFLFGERDDMMADLSGIYCIQAEESRAIKIGITSKAVTERILSLQTGNHEKLNIIWLYRGNRWSEKQIHEALEEYRIHDEWFDGNSAVHYFIKEELYNSRYIKFEGKEIEVTHRYPCNIELKVTTKYKFN